MRWENLLYFHYELKMLYIYYMRIRMLKIECFSTVMQRESANMKSFICDRREIKLNCCKNSPRETIYLTSHYMLLAYLFCEYIYSNIC